MPKYKKNEQGIEVVTLEIEVPKEIAHSLKQVSNSIGRSVSKIVFNGLLNMIKDFSTDEIKAQVSERFSEDERVELSHDPLEQWRKKLNGDSEEKPIDETPTVETEATEHKEYTPPTNRRK